MTTAAPDIEDMVGGPEFAPRAQSLNKVCSAVNVGRDVALRANQEPELTRRHEHIASAQSFPDVIEQFGQGSEIALANAPVQAPPRRNSPSLVVWPRHTHPDTTSSQ